MSKKIQKSFVLDNENLEYLNTVISKNLSNTIDNLVSKAREQSLQVDFVRKFENPTKNIGCVLSPENVEFIESIKNNSFGFTLNCLIATVKDSEQKSI